MTKNSGINSGAKRFNQRMGALLNSPEAKRQIRAVLENPKNPHFRSIVATMRLYSPNPTYRADFADLLALLPKEDK